MRRAISCILIAFLLIGLSTFTFSIQPAKAWVGTVYIKADGSIDPIDAPIQRNGDLYTMNDSIGSFQNPLIIQRSNIIFDGQGHSIYADRGGMVNVTSMNNVMLRNLWIDNCTVYLHQSTNCVVGWNNFRYISSRISVYEGSNNVIIGNNFEDKPSGSDGISIMYSSYSNVTGNTLKGSSIYVQYSNHCTFSANIFEKSGLFLWDSFVNSAFNNSVNGKPLVYLEGISDHVVGEAGQVVLISCRNVTVANLNLSNTCIGVELWNTNSSQITLNQLVNNLRGLLLGDSFNNTIRENNIERNGVIGIQMINSSENTIIRNKINSSPIEGLSLSFSNFTKIIDNDIEMNGDGVFLVASSNNSIVGNRILANNYTGLNPLNSGINLRWYSYNNTVIGNTIEANDYGVYFYSPSENNILYHNNFINNLVQVSEHPNNIWDNGYPSGGNYWSDYTQRYPNASEIDDSHLWNMSYIFSIGNQDNYPLMYEWTTRPPFPFFSWSSTAPKVGESIIYNASLSQAGWNGTKEMPIIEYRWDFGDGNTTSTTNTTVTHVYEQPNSFNVTLTVFDTGGLNASLPKQILVKMPTSLSASTTSPSTYVGFRVDINGTLRDWYGRGLNNETILISYTFSGAPSWFPITSSLTNSSGEYSAQWIPTATGYFTIKVEWAGNYTYFGANSTVALSTLPYENQYVFTVESNSTISNLAFDSTSHRLSFSVDGENGTIGYTRVTIAKSLAPDITKLKVTFDNIEYTYTVTNMTDSWVLVFTYNHSIHQVEVDFNQSPVPEFPPFLVLPLFMMATLLAVVIYRSKISRTRNPETSESPDESPDNTKRSSRPKIACFSL